MLQVLPIQAFKDNYIWLIQQPNSRQCIVVDPGDATPVRQYLQEYNLSLHAILITHHHQDHSGGIQELCDHYHDVVVYGPIAENIAGVTHPVAATQKITLPALELSLQVIDIPGHTRGHIAYYGKELLFCGDTLFAAGCGRLFEGSAAQMVASLAKLAALPQATKIYCGHEYTLNNLKFAVAVEPGNPAILQRLDQVQTLREQQLPTLPSTVGLEQQTNPFLRCHLATVKAAAEHYAQQALANEIEVFASLREWKNQT